MGWVSRRTRTPLALTVRRSSPDAAAVVSASRLGRSVKATRCGLATTPPRAVEHEEERVRRAQGVVFGVDLAITADGSRRRCWRRRGGRGRRRRWGRGESWREGGRGRPILAVTLAVAAAVAAVLGRRRRLKRRRDRLRRGRAGRGRRLEADQHVGGGCVEALVDRLIERLERCCRSDEADGREQRGNHGQGEDRQAGGRAPDEPLAWPDGRRLRRADEAHTQRRGRSAARSAARGR